MREQEFTTTFLDFRKELQSFLYRLVTNEQDVEDFIQDTYVKALEKLNTYQEEKASLKTWVFTIALNTAKNHIAKLKRWGENDLSICERHHKANPDRLAAAIQVFHSRPDAVFEMKEHLEYCFTCISKTLELTQQVCVLLKEVYGFKQHEIMQITALSEGKVKHGIVNGRRHMKRIFNDRCALINKDGVCTQCTELNGIFNPTQDAHRKAQELKLSKEEKDQDKLLDLRFALVQEVHPFYTGSSLHLYFAKHLQEWVVLEQS